MSSPGSYFEGGSYFFEVGTERGVNCEEELIRAGGGGSRLKTQMKVSFV